ncbi:serine carboxypeptidase 1-like [Camellia sinensis]|uniref:serine carboxypeptidase 1-like n=1 Tax=Camellia sinensis TaxID=4442 RepID=UPI0010362A35|nr:serine carboxypeptidase 1-like [Camellia sinensis]
MMGMEKLIVILKISSVWCLLLGCEIIIVEAAPKASRIKSLPGFNGTFPSKHYSGYVTINGDIAPSKNLFYYFVVSERNPRDDPVVLWLNGGPGCSSFDGFVYEHGPFNFEAGKTEGSLPKLHLNPYSWSKVSNMIYLDSPAGVGFSYSKNTTIYKTGDLQTASDTHDFLIKWFNLYPKFVSNPFYIAGESYGGVYVPTLTSQVLKGLIAGEKPIINLKGYIVGNGVADEIFDGNGLVPFAHGMALIPDEMYEEAMTSCKGNYYNPPNNKCEIAVEKVNVAIDGLNLYDILEPCYHRPTTTSEDANGNKNTTSSTIPLSFKQLGVTEKPLAVRKRIYGRAWPFRAPVKVGVIPMWPELMKSAGIDVPCTDDTVATAWLNNDAVRKAIHVNQGSGSWSLCTNDLLYNGDAGSIIPYHKNLTAQGYRALIYSGDHDMCVPYTGSQAWIRSLGYKITDEWRPWMTNDQVAGYTQGYDNGLTFLTIKGAGHTVPEYKPREALHFYSNWLEGKQI